MARICTWHSAISSAVACAPTEITTAPLDTRSRWPTAHSSTRMPPIEPPTTRVPAVDAERVGQRDLERDLVADRGDREARAVRTAVAGAVRRRTGRALAAAEHVRAHHEEPVGVDRASRARWCRPTSRRRRARARPARPRGCRGERVQHEHRVRPRRARACPTSRTRPSTVVERAAGLELQAVGERARTAGGPGSSPGRHAPVTGQQLGRRRRSGLRRAEAGVEVGEDVVDRLDADRQAHEVGRDPGRAPARPVRAAGGSWSPGGWPGCARHPRWPGGCAARARRRTSGRPRAHP